MNVARRIALLACGRRTKWTVLGFWIILLAVSGPLAGKLTDAQENEVSGWLPANAESTEVLELQQEFGDAETVPALVVYERTSGITDADQAEAARDAERFAEIDGVGDEVTDPIPSEDGEALQTVVPITVGDEGWFKIGEIVEEMRAIAGDGDAPTAEITGPAGYAADFADAFEGIDGTLLYAAAAVVIAVLLLTYRSPILWILPLFSAAAALFSAQAVIYLLAEYADVTVNAQSAGILTVLVFGAGTDYALLLVARYREELRRHEDRHEAMALALHRAGPAIIASAGTVAAGMLCLVFAEMNSTAGMGPIVAIGVVLALFSMLTLLPALLVIVGRWIFWPVRPTLGSAEPTQTGLWAKMGRGIARGPRRVWIGTSVVLGAMALGLLTMNPGVIANEDAFIGESNAVTGDEMLSRHYPAGSGQPVVVISDADAAGDVQEAFDDTDGIVDVAEPVVRGDHAMLEGTLSAEPDSEAARDTIERVRDNVHAVPDANAIAGGDTAIALDAAEASGRDNLVIMPLVLAVVFLILALLLRALLAPLVLIATVVLSFAAALGTSALVFEYLFGFEGVDSAFPLFVFVFLVALGIDYNIFLMTRVREESARAGTRRGSLLGLAATGGVITSAGLVLAGTFSVMATLPAVAFAEIGFAVAFGVLLDTMIVRGVLVTALNLDIGGKMWWPSKLTQVPDPDWSDVEQEETAVRTT